MKKRGFFTPWRIVASIFLGLVAFGLLLALLMQGRDLPVFSPSGIIAQQEKDLIIFTLLLSTVVVVPVFLMLGIFATRYRANGGTGQYTPDEEDNHWFEVLWWGIPILIIGILGVVTVVSTHQLDPSRPLVSSVKPLNVQVVALQWRWLFIYPDKGIATINELHIPTGTPIDFRLTADGPMAGFWVPALGTQTYAMTGMSMPLKLQADKEGSYRGSNSNITGTGYSDMDFQTIATSRSDFDKWASGVVANKNHQHIDWGVYESAAMPVRDKSVYYYHLHDHNLYNEVVKKYASNGHGNSGAGGSH